MLVIVLAVALMIFAAACLSAADKDTAANNVGFVDIQKVFFECNDAKTGTAALQAEGDTLKKQLEKMAERSLLTDDQRAEAEKLDVVAKPSDAQQKRLSELNAEAKKYEDELKTLQQVTTPDETQKVRLTELTNRQRQTVQKLQELQQKYSSTLNTKNQDLSAKIQDKIKTAIEQVGKTKGYSTIVDKQVILYGGMDLTDEVLKVVNSQK
jgi:outer membrane protein